MPEKHHIVKSARVSVKSIADTVGDFFFYFHLTTLDPDSVDHLREIIAISIASSVIGALLAVYTIWTVWRGTCRARSPRTVISCWFAELTEILFEDIPQLAITGWIVWELREFTPTAVFNLSTSGMNLFLAVLDLWEECGCDGDDEDDEEEEGAEKTGSARYYATY